MASPPVNSLCEKWQPYIPVVAFAITVSVLILGGGGIVLPAAAALTTTGNFVPRWCFRYSPSRRPSKCPTIQVMLASCKDNRSNESEEAPSYQSIGQVVGGLHGGKYQFDSSGGMNNVLSGPPGSAETTLAPPPPGELPKWAIHMKANKEDARKLKVPSNGMIRFASITITNEERTWEPFYAKVVVSFSCSSLSQLNEYSGGHNLFQVRPASGDLAPRGGASNACNANQPYSDSATLQVVHNENHCAEVTRDKVECWLVAGTEEETWSWRLDLVSE